MFGPSYSNKAMVMTVNALKELDSRIEEDFEDFPPSNIPENHEWQRTGLGDYLFNSKKKQKSIQRTVFNFGVMTGLAEHYYDGKPNEFDKFLRKAVMSGVHFPKVVLNAEKLSKKFTKEFSIGVKWSMTFRKRHEL